ncbi:MAG TPA: TonB-dependent receptor plug domain-containing protein, partial [Hanamia sp.]|nr:TonB-dependent receptor plug domain-containing protein [Hanamia sp.]
MGKKLLFSGLFLFCCIFQSMAQQRTITGKVTATDGSPLVGVSVLVVGQKTGVTTESDGTFTINVPENAKALQISYVGFEPKTVDISSATNVNVELVNSAASLTDVVVVGYGTSRRRDLTGAITSIKANDFNQGAIAAPDQLLQGKVSGLEITTNNGQPGAATTIKIRGNNSIRSGGNPLYVIDGVPLDGRTAKPGLNFGGSGLDFGTTPESNPLLYVNPNDIAQIDVLKDASSTAIYGSRGANGVIIITTKRGTSGNTKVEFGTKFGVNAGYMHKYKVLSASQFRTALHTYSLDTLSNSLDHGGSVDALKAITQNSLSQSYNLAFSGGNERGKFRVSFLGSQDFGFIKKTSLDKYLGNFTGEYKFLDNRLSINFDVIAGHTTENMGLISNTAGAGGNLMAWALNWNPTAAFTTSNGLFSNAVNSVPNPLAVIEGYSDVSNVNVFLGNI